MTDKEDFASLLDQFDQAPEHQAKAAPKPGDKVHGRIVSLSGDYAFVDLGGKAEGAIRTEELADPEGKISVNVGDTIDAVVMRADEGSGGLLLGRKTDRLAQGSEALESAYHGRLPVEGTVTGVIKGGVEVKIAGVRGFCPASQLALGYVEEMEQFVGQKLAFRITRYEGGRHVNLVVSRRDLLEEERQAQAEQVRASLEVGAVLPGVVTSIKDYGAFVDLGGIEGMVHISELAFGRVKHPSDMLAVGQPVEVAVLRIEATDNPRHPQKIALSLRALAKDPWQDAAQQFSAGTRVKGTVTRLQPFGAFVELAPGIEGLVHISELGAGRRISNPQEVVESGQSVEATVLSVDLEKRRIALSMDSSREVDTDIPDASAYAADKEPASDVGSFGMLLKESLKKKT